MVTGVDAVGEAVVDPDARDPVLGERPLEAVADRDAAAQQRDAALTGVDVLREDGAGLDLTDVHKDASTTRVFDLQGSRLRVRWLTLRARDAPCHISSRARRRTAFREVRDHEIVAFPHGETVLARLASGDRTPARGEAFPLDDVTLLAPVPRPRAIFGIGLNYRAHAEEGGRGVPDAPIVFMKLPTSAAAPNAPVRCPPVVRRLDFEGELAVVMGTGGEVAGYAVADDVSARDLQKREPQWTRAKGA
jgi:hypothetical protein